MFDCGYHGNNATDCRNTAVFVHPHTEPASTQKIKKASNFSFSTLHHFSTESFLIVLKHREEVIRSLISGEMFCDHDSNALLIGSLLTFSLNEINEPIHN